MADAQADARITAAAVVGSGAAGNEDQWSDIDLALRLAPGVSAADVTEAWTDRMYHRHGAVSHLDIWSGATLFRVFVLDTTLQVDLSFWLTDDFAPHDGPFKLIFGNANPAAHQQPRDLDTTLGMAWLYALHARSSIARGRNHQALHMLNGMRDQLIIMACSLAGVVADQGRGTDDLPAPVRRQLELTTVRSLEPTELVRAFAELARFHDGQAEIHSSRIARAIAPVIAELVRTATSAIDPLRP